MALISSIAAKMVDTNQASGTTPPSRARARVVSAACDSLPRRSNSRNPELHLIVWKKRSEEHTSEIQSLMRNSYYVFCLKTKKTNTQSTSTNTNIHTNNKPVRG